MKTPENKFSRKSARSLFGSNEFQVNCTQSTATKYDIYLFGPIEDHGQIIEGLQVMEAAGEGDLVIIHLSTPGGVIDVADTFIQGMYNCAAKVVVRASGGVCSAGTMILLAAPEFTLSHGFYAMCHNGSFGAWGKTSDVKSHVAFAGAWLDQMSREVYEGFMTEEEIDLMNSGKDFWMDSAEFMRRIKMREEWEETMGQNDVEEDSEGLPEIVQEMLDNTQVH